MVVLSKALIEPAAWQAVLGGAILHLSLGAWLRAARGQRFRRLIHLVSSAPHGVMLVTLSEPCVHRSYDCAVALPLPRRVTRLWIPLPPPPAAAAVAAAAADAHHRRAHCPPHCHRPRPPIFVSADCRPLPPSSPPAPAAALL
jgi:hypothetical protein